jgi:hypothetical protein
MQTSRSATMGRAIVIAALAAGAGLLGLSAGASAQVTQPRDAPPVDTGEVPRAASPNGAVYIPGVGFRYVAPLPRVYGYYAAGPRVYAYSDSREARRYRA